MIAAISLKREKKRKEKEIVQLIVIVLQDIKRKEKVIESTQRKVLKRRKNLLKRKRENLPNLRVLVQIQIMKKRR